MIDIKPETDWHCTAELGWKVLPGGDRELMQLWRSKDGNSEWRVIKTVDPEAPIKPS